MTTVGDRIKAMRKERDKMSRKRLEQLTGIGYSSIAELERGGQQTTTKLHLYAKALGVHEAWLATGKAPKYLTEGADAETWPEITAFDQGVSLGEGVTAEEWQETHKLKFRADSLRRKGLRADKLVVYYGRGDSMEPRIKDGDAILFNTAETEPVDDAIFVVRYEGHEYAKRLQKLGDQWFMVSENVHDPKWRKPRAIDHRKGFEVLGRVRWIGSWED